MLRLPLQRWRGGGPLQGRVGSCLALRNALRRGADKAGGLAGEAAAAASSRAGRPELSATRLQSRVFTVMGLVSGLSLANHLTRGPSLRARARLSQRMREEDCRRRQDTWPPLLTLPRSSLGTWPLLLTLPVLPLGGALLVLHALPPLGR